MDKKPKGLADTGQGEFILNESGTSVSTDSVEPASDPTGPSSETETESKAIDTSDE
jgi:hypothetical protein